MIALRWQIHSLVFSPCRLSSSLYFLYSDSHSLQWAPNHSCTTVDLNLCRPCRCSGSFSVFRLPLLFLPVCVCVCVCVCVREIERERDSVCLCISVCLCGCVVSLALPQSENPNEGTSQCSFSLSRSLSHTHTHTHTHAHTRTAVLWQLSDWRVEAPRRATFPSQRGTSQVKHPVIIILPCVVYLCVFHMYVCCPPKTWAMYHSLQLPVRPLSLHICSLVSTCGLMHWTFQPICQAAWRWKSPSGGKKASLLVYAQPLTYRAQVALLLRGFISCLRGPSPFSDSGSPRRAGAKAAAAAGSTGGSVARCWEACLPPTA